MKKGLYVILIVVFVLAFAVSGVYLMDYYLSSVKAEKKYNDLSAIVESAQQGTRPAAEPTAEPVSETKAEQEPVQAAEEPTEPGGMLPGYKELHDKNPDMAGWIRIEDTPINYPVMQTSVDNANFYLYRDFDREDSDHGSIYVREECDMLKPSDNVTIYGHNMRDYSMFGVLGEYYEKEYWQTHSLIFFDTLYEYHVYKIFAVFKTSVEEGVGFEYHLMEDAKDAQDFNAFIAKCKGLSFYDTGITPVYGDKIICLSTCEYTLEDGRFVLAAVRIS